MEQFFIFIIVKFLDPIGFGVVLMASLFLKEKRFVYVAAIITAIALESYVASVNHVVKWGMAIIPGIIASFLHALLCNWAVLKFKGSSDKKGIKGKAIKYMVTTIGISKEAATEFSAHIDSESIDYLEQYIKNGEQRIVALMPLFATVIAAEKHPNQDEPLVQGLKADLKYITDVQFTEALVNNEITSDFFNVMVNFSATTAAFLADSTSSKSA